MLLLSPPLPSNRIVWQKPINCSRPIFCSKHYNALQTTQSEMKNPGNVEGAYKPFIFLHPLKVFTPVIHFLEVFPHFCRAIPYWDSLPNTAFSMRSLTILLKKSQSHLLTLPFIYPPSLLSTFSLENFTILCSTYLAIVIYCGIPFRM